MVLQGQPGAQSNVGIVVGSRGVLVIDSGAWPPEWRDPRRRRAPGSLRVGPRCMWAATHFHPETHDGRIGVSAESAIVVRSMGQQLDIDATGAAEGRGVVELFRQMPNRARRYGRGGLSHAGHAVRR